MTPGTSAADVLFDIYHFSQTFVIFLRQKQYRMPVLTLRGEKVQSPLVPGAL